MEVYDAFSYCGRSASFDGYGVFMKNLFYLILIFTVTVSVFAQNADDFTFTVNTSENPQTITITGYRGRKTQNLIFPEKINNIPVVEISKGNFSYFNIETVFIPATITYIDLGSRNGWISSHDFISYNVDPNNANYCSIDGVLFSKDQSILLSFPMGKSISEYTIPDTVTVIGKSAFVNSKYILSVVLPESLVAIKDSAFAGCAGLNEIIIPNNVNVIGPYAFYGCRSLKSVKVSIVTNIYRIADIGKFAFGECTELEEITIPSPYTLIGYGAFEYTYKLRNDIKEIIVEIFGERVFYEGK